LARLGIAAIPIKPMKSRANTLPQGHATKGKTPNPLCLFNNFIIGQY